MKRRLLSCLLIVVSLVAHHIPMMGESVDSLYLSYLKAPVHQKGKVADAVYRCLHNEHFTDTLIRTDPKASPAQAECNLHYWMAEYYYNQEDFESSRDAGNRALDLLSQIKDLAFKSEVLATLSNIQFRLGYYDQALTLLLQAYSIDKKLGNDELISSDQNSLAAIYLAAQQPEPGINYIEKAIALERKLKRPDRLAIRLGLASELYLMNNELEKALNCINEAYEIDNHDGRTEKAAIRLSQKAAVMERLGIHNEARAHVLKALSVLEKVQNLYSMAVCYNQLGSIEQKLGNIEAANTYYKKALEHSIACGAPRIEQIAERGLWETMRNSNPQVALLHLERYTTLSDSLNTRIAAVQAKVLDATLSNFEQNELTEKSQRTHIFLAWGITLLGLMLLVTIAGLLMAWRRSKKALNIQRQTQSMRTLFFNNITHELHTPLTVITSAGQKLCDGTKTTTEENKHLGELIINHSNNMLTLVNQLLNIEEMRDGIGKPEIRQGDIVLFVRMLVDNFSEQAANHHINLAFSSPIKSLMVEFPLNYIRQIVHNLIANALKFTGTHGTINVSMVPLDGGKVQLSVSDTGKGIPKSEISRIFEPFTQSRNGDDAVGTSLDLSLVYQLVKSMNGTITVDSEEGQGTTFNMTLPLKSATEWGIEQQEQTAHFIENRLRQNDDMKHKPLVFIVENNEDVAFFITSHLRDNYNLRFARDGREAYINAQDLVPDLIVTSILMPVMDGKELIKRLRANSALSHIPIVAMTTDTSNDERMDCIEAGADAVLVKPFNSSELLLVVKHFINQRNTMREHFVNTNSNQLNEEAPTQELSKNDQEFINKLINVIHAQMVKNDIDMEHIAAALSLSRKQLRTRVMAITGMTPIAYVLQVRLNYARRMISSDNSSLTTIASKCGFQNLSHFSKAFKQQFGVSPQQFRKNIDSIGDGH